QSPACNVIPTPSGRGICCLHRTLESRSLVALRAPRDDACVANRGPLARPTLGRKRHFLSGSSFFLSLPGMYGLHGFVRTGPDVFQTTVNWPLACTSPMNTGLCKW